MNAPLIMLLALAIDLCLGWPSWLFARIGHPVTWAGKAISAGDRWLNRSADSDRLRRAAGAVMTVLLVALALAVGATVTALLPGGWLTGCILAVLAWPLVAARSMADHVRAVAMPLAQGDAEAARHAVAMIVGRETSRLDETGIARAAIESLAENTSDGITAPLFWGAVLGLPGIAGYKMINTLDSMIGYRTPRHEEFGWAAARLDDVVNWIPARLTGVLFACVSANPGAALAAMRADARRHRSPNAGWTEAAMAGALGLRLSGPRQYETGPTQDPYVNASGQDPKPRDISRALRLYWRALAAMAVLLAVAGGLIHA